MDFALLLGRPDPRSPKFFFFFNYPSPWKKAPPSNGFQDQGAASGPPFCRIPAPGIHLGVPEGGAAWVLAAGPEGDLASLPGGISRQLRESGWW